MLYSGSEYKPPTTPFICAGDRVQLVMDIELLKSCQDKIDAWDDGLIMVQNHAICIFVFTLLSVVFG